LILTRTENKRKLYNNNNQKKRPQPVKVISNDVTLDPHYHVIDFLAAPEGGEEGKTTKMLGLVHFSFLSNKKKKLLREMRMDRRNALAGEQTNDKGGHYPKQKPKNKQNKNGRLLVVKL
jgi:hypothetical protein